MSVIDHLSTIIGAPAVAAAGTNNEKINCQQFYYICKYECFTYVSLN